MPNLIDFFTPLFSFGLELERQLGAQRDGIAPAGQVHQQLLEKIAAANAAARQAGKREQDVREANFAFVAWLDEITADHAAWLAATTPLQKRLFDTTNAGDEFFDHLARLTAQQDEVREVYFVAMGLGFVGRYYFDTGESGELARLKETHGRQLPDAPAAVATLPEEHITAQPYLAADPAGPSLPRRWDTLVLSTGLVVSLLIPIALWFYYRPPDTVNEQPAPELVLQPPAAPDPGPSLADRLRELQSRFECARLSAELGAEGQVLWRGHVSKAQDQNRLVDATREIVGVTAVEARLDLLIWPFCEAVEILAPYREAGRSRGVGPGVAPYRHAERFVAGEYLVLALTAPADYDAFIYVDYYQRDGTVVHMLPNASAPDNRLGRGQTKILGLPDQDEIPWRVQAPFGREMIAILAVPAPLAEEQRPLYESARDYFPALRRHVTQEQFTADYLFIRTTAKSP